MARFVKIGADIIDLDAVTRIAILENQSGISDRIVLDVGGATVIVDSSIGGRARMDAIREKLVQALEPEDWEAPEVKL